MPVMVVGVENVVGDAAVRLLASKGGEVRVFVRAPDPALDASGQDEEDTRDPQTYRDLGCKVAHGFLDDEAHVETALEQVHTVLLLHGRPTDDPDAYLDEAATVIGAAIGAGCRRLVLLSDAAVADPAGNPWLEALAEAEEMAADAPLESVVLRAGLIYGHGDPLTTALAAGAAGPDPAGSHWPIAARDVAVAAVLADDNRDLDSALHVVLDLAGPEQASTADLASRLREVVAAAPGADLPAAALDLVGREIDRPDGALGATGAVLADFAAG